MLIPDFYLFPIANVTKDTHGPPKRVNSQPAVRILTTLSAHLPSLTFSNKAPAAPQTLPVLSPTLSPGLCGSLSGWPLPVLASFSLPKWLISASSHFMAMISHFSPNTIVSLRTKSLFIYFSYIFTF